MSGSGTNGGWRRRLVLVFIVALLCTVWIGGHLGGSFAENTVWAEQDQGDQNDVSYDEHRGGEGGSNIVQVKNHKDGRLRIRGNIQLNRIPGQRVAPINSAYAYSSCTDCQTLAVAMQINLIGRHATTVIPKNESVAVNYRCTRCVTVAVALQYVYSVDDPNQVPDEVDRLIKDMNRELKAVAKDKHATLAAAANRIDAVIARFQELAKSLDDNRAKTTADTSPNAAPDASPVASPEASPQTGATPTPGNATTSQAAPDATASTDSSTAPAETVTPEATSSDTNAAPSETATEPTATPTATPTQEPTPPPQNATPPA